MQRLRVPAGPWGRAMRVVRRRVALSQRARSSERGVCSGVGSQRAQGSERGEWGNAVVVGTRRRRCKFVSGRCSHLPACQLPSLLRPPPLLPQLAAATQVSQVLEMPWGLGGGSRPSSCVGEQGGVNTSAVLSSRATRSGVHPCVPLALYLPTEHGRTQHRALCSEILLFVSIDLSR